MSVLSKSLMILSLSYALPLLADGAGEKVSEGLENVKNGTKQAAEGLGTAAQEAGTKASVVGQKVSRVLKSATCPVVADRSTKFYYAKDSKSYAKVLDGQKYFEDDDRACFMSEEAARAEGYKRDPN